MRVTCKAEQSLFDFDEFELIKPTHHPAIYDVDAVGLADLQHRLRQLRDREKTLARQKQREVRGKSEARGAGFPGTAERPHRRKTAMTAALRRIAKELRRQEVVAARAAHAEAARRALAMHRAAKFVHHPPNPDTPAPDLRSIPSRQRRHRVPPAHIGRVSQHTKIRQAVRDARG